MDSINIFLACANERNEVFLKILSYIPWIYYFSKLLPDINEKNLNEPGICI